MWLLLEIPTEHGHATPRPSAQCNGPGGGRVILQSDYRRTYVPAGRDATSAVRLMHIHRPPRPYSRGRSRRPWSVRQMHSGAAIGAEACGTGYRERSPGSVHAAHKQAAMTSCPPSGRSDEWRASKPRSSRAAGSTTTPDVEWPARRAEEGRGASSITAAPAARAAGQGQARSTIRVFFLPVRTTQ